MLFCGSLLTALCCPLISLLSLLSSLCLSSHFSLLLVVVILRDSPHDCDNHTRLSATKQSHCSLLPSLFPYSHFSPISSVADAHLLDRTAHQSLRALLQAIDSASTSIHGALCLTSTLSAPSRPWILCICIKMLLPIDFHFSVAEVFRVLDPTCYTTRNISPHLGKARIKRTPIQQAESSPFQDRTSHLSLRTLHQATEHAANSIPLCLNIPGPAECAKRLNKIMKCNIILEHYANLS